MQLNLALFPNLEKEGYSVESPPTPAYNCIAWAGGYDDAWYDPYHGTFSYWPRRIPREWSINALIQLFRSWGYSECADETFESEFQKIALYALDGTPTHAARQLPNGLWTSKIGADEDIFHHTLEGLEGEAYGEAIKFFKRRISP